MKVDLHVHTTYSDGFKTPKEILEIAIKNNIDVIAITDHDSVLGAIEALKNPLSKNIKVIPGIELSTLYKGESVHVIGLFKGNNISNDMLQYMDMIRKKRYERGILMLKKIESIYHVKINYDRILLGDMITRGNMFKEISLSNPEMSISLINEIVSKKSKAYIPIPFMNTNDGIDFLKKNNALTILAHPTLLSDDIKEELLEMPFDGIEARYPLNKKDEEKKFIDKAYMNHKFITAGSDYHGDPNHAYIGDVYLNEDEYNIVKSKLE